MNNRLECDACDAVVMHIVISWIGSGKGFVMLVMLLALFFLCAREYFSGSQSSYSFDCPV